MDYLIKNAVAVASTGFSDARDLRIRGGYITELGNALAPTQAVSYTHLTLPTICSV